MAHRETAENSEAFQNNETGGPFDDMATLVVLIGASVRDTARLMGLEARLVIKTIVTMVMLGVVLGLVILGVWLSITLVVAAGLYEYTGLGLTLSIAAASIINVACALALVLLLKRLAQRLAFPETRLAVRTLLEDASGTMQKQE
jgi:hypothetical protein